MQQLKITKGERRLVSVSVVSIALVLGIGLWHYNLEVDPVVNIPTPAMPSPNAFDFYVKAGKTHEALRLATAGADTIDPVTDLRSHARFSPQQLAQHYPTVAKEAWIRKNAPALQLLQQGMKYQYYQPPIRSFKTVLLAPLQDFRDLARLLVIESHAKSERGDWAGASRSTLDILHLGHDVPRGGALAVSLFGSAINAIGRKEFRNTLPHLDAAAARAAATQIEKLESSRVSCAEMLREEKWMTQASLEKTMKSPDWRSGSCTMDNITNWRCVARLRITSKRRILDNYTDYMDALIVQAKKPYTSWQTVPLPHDPVNELIAPSFVRMRAFIARDETDDSMLAVELALRAFNLENRTFPETLQELIPTYLKKVPLDPFGGGEALHYRKTGKSYLLYSIGPDGKDDGGKVIDDPALATSSSPSARYRMQFESKGDYMAGINR